MKRNSYYDIDKIFLRGLTVRDIAEPLPSFDSQTPVKQVRAKMDLHQFQVVGVRENGYVAGYLERSDLGTTGPCGHYCHPIEEAKILKESAPLSDLVLALNTVPYLFVNFLGEVSGIVTRADLDDPPVRMWLFGLITLIEMRFLTLIELHLDGESWQKYISNSRLEKAAALQTERRRRNQDPSLLDCLQFSDKGQIVIRDEYLRKQLGFASRKRGSEAIKNLEKLRNNLAHAQDIVSLDWETIVTISENLEAVVRIGLGEE
jgi:CBS domain-containing protein